MLKFLKRWMAYFLIPAGLVLLLIPLNTHHQETIDKDFVFLQISETLSPELTAAPSPESPAGNSTERMQIKEQQRNLFQDSAGTSTITNPYGYPIIQKQDLIPYPALQEKVNYLIRLLTLWRQKNIGPQRLDNVPIEEWIAFRKVFLDNMDDPAFQYGNYIFKGHLKPSYASISVEVENLRLACKVTGGIFLFLSLLALYGMYKVPSNGIQIGKWKGIIVWDIIVIGFGIIFTWWFLDFILMKFFKTDSAWKDEFVMGMGIFWVAFINPVMALFTTATALQTVRIDEEGINVKGLFGQSSIPWTDVKDIQISEFSAPRIRGGILSSRSIMQMLEIGGSSSSLRILEPPLPSSKKELLDALAEYAPQKLQETISGLKKEW